MPQLGESLTDDSRSVIYNRNVFIIQATGLIYINKVLPIVWNIILTRVESGKASTKVTNALAYQAKRCNNPKIDLLEKIK